MNYENFSNTYRDIYDGILGNNKLIWTVEDSEHCEIWIGYNSNIVIR